MWLRLAAGLMACTTGVAWAGTEIPAMPKDGLRAFMRAVVEGEARSPRHFAQELALLRHRNGRDSVLPTLTVIAGKLGDGRCVYQLRVESWTLDGQRADDAHVDRQSTGGRSTLKQSSCDTLVEEVLAVAEYEVGSLQRRVVHGAARASNQGRDAVVAAVRDSASQLPPSDAPVMVAQTLPSRVNLRAAPSLTAPVRTTLPPSTRLEVVQTAQSDWYALRDGRGFVHARGLRLHAAGASAEPVLRARLRAAYVPVREEPSLRARVLARLKPSAEVRVVAQPQDGWHRLADQPGYIPVAALAAPADSTMSVAGAPAGLSRLRR